ncbi:MAG: SRPBCC domain-containing protein [Saprospiraceae bacterium]|nr:SRPBCC domain-containing protein [Bacteroidia bacterium]NNE13553.1 SRPBCC domain-containing protein [Saprospiraceae bacterium]NNL93071.1 SRPBCC domain-containing protein [Saprospiraceae bacterium]
MKTSDPNLVLTKEYDCSKEKLWQALTNHETMIQWYFENIPAFEPIVGFSTVFTVNSETREFIHNWIITESIPNKRIAYSWHFDGYEGKSISIFDIEEKENKTILTLTIKILTDFNDEITEFKRESCIGGWNYFLGDRLEPFLNKD